MVEPRLLPGGGATEMALAHALNERGKGVVGVGQWPYRAIAKALEVIPRTLLQNCGANTIRVLTALRVSGMGVREYVERNYVGMGLRGNGLLPSQAKHAVAGNVAWGVDGDTGELVDMTALGVWDPLSVKVQTYKTAIEVCVCSLSLFSFVC